ncbi:response regulator [Pseudomonas sp. JS3066]|uniref:response regulator n=1 Tax=unclassified Pseudomonas TaxID=196821 RepID=UPI000EAA2589|nr:MULTISPECIES: response regulator [unclassified Pseudomonas]AYF89881.1 response regulator [Pseudomonas sp. DY-1]WVK92532.1 response regulator [Pseudomonas sp. JS3066]
MSQSPMLRQQLLLVDDEEDILQELAEMLEGEGFYCHTATSVRSAIDLLLLHPNISLVVTDLRMPEESGMRLIQRLRAHTNKQHLPVIVTSGHADMDDVIDVLRLHVIDFFRKPIYLERLVEVIKDQFPQPQLKLVSN